MGMTEERFLTVYRDELSKRYEWAADIPKLNRFMATCQRSLETTGVGDWNHEGEAVTAAWHAIGGLVFRDQIWYNPITGVFYWLVNKRGPVKAGDVAGSLNGQGYWRIKIDQEVFMAHRIAWFLVYGVWPENEIDHIDGDPLNNRIDNLRDCTRAQNCKNVKSLGASFDKKRNKWLARICVDYKQINLGRFDRREDAIRAAKEARDHYFGEFSRG